jgi:hypothetical protein
MGLLYPFNSSKKAGGNRSVGRPWSFEQAPSCHEGSDAPLFFNDLDQPICFDSDPCILRALASVPTRLPKLSPSAKLLAPGSAGGNYSPVCRPLKELSNMKVTILPCLAGLTVNQGTTPVKVVALPVVTIGDQFLQQSTVMSTG